MKFEFFLQCPLLNRRIQCHFEIDGTSVTIWRSGGMNNKKHVGDRVALDELMLSMTSEELQTKSAHFFQLYSTFHGHRYLAFDFFIKEIIELLSLYISAGSLEWKNSVSWYFIL